MFHKITAVAPLPDFHLLAQFSDGAARDYDLTPLFARFPAFRALETTQDLMEQVQVDPGGYGVSWNDELDLSAEEIFQGGRTVHSEQRSETI